MVIVSPEVFKRAFLTRLRERRVKKVDIVNRRRFSAHFGLDEDACAILWNKLYSVDPASMVDWKPYHLLDALFFLNVYSAEGVGACFAGCDEKTLRKWNWRVLDAIANLDCVRCFFVSSPECLNTLHGPPQ